MTSNISENMASERLVFLDNLRAVAIIMVVGIHTLGYCLPLAENHKTVISTIISIVPVPLFFLVDGYLFAKKVVSQNGYNYSDAVKKSAFRLLLPWFFFHCFTSLRDIFLNYLVL